MTEGRLRVVVTRHAPFASLAQRNTLEYTPLYMALMLHLHSRALHKGATLTPAARHVPQR